MWTVQIEGVQNLLSENGALQVFADGGFDGANGAAGVVIVGITTDGGDLHRSIFGARDFFLKSARSSLEAELIAIEAAADMILAITERQNR